MRLIVENRGGAGAVIGAGRMAKSPPDGYTLVMGKPGSMKAHLHAALAKYARIVKSAGIKVD